MPSHTHLYPQAFALALATLATFSAVSEEKPAVQQAPETELFRAHTPDAFRKLDAARQGIDVQNFREELLSAAIFHGINARRLEQQLPALALQPQVRAACLAHARLMAAGRFLSHGTPGQAHDTTPRDRLLQQGLQPRYSAENIALNFVLRIEPGKPFHTRKENGRTIYSYEAHGEPILPHTYLSLAEAFVAQWMTSPLHRKNLLAIEPEFTGVGCALSKDEKGFDTVYANQGFFAPRDDATKQ